MVRDAADAVQMGGHPRLLAEAEQLHGIVFDAESMAFGEDICKQANLPDSIFFDTMHNVCASGGFAQYEANQFCRRVKGHGIPLKCWTRGIRAFIRLDRGLRSWASIGFRHASVMLLMGVIVERMLARY